jgi:hypothetical protein
MIVTGAMLAEAATVADGKLYVLGGVLTNFWQPPQGHRIEALLVVLIQAEESDRKDPQTVEVTITAPDGKHGAVNLSVPEAATSGTSAGFSYHRSASTLRLPIDTSSLWDRCHFQLRFIHRNLISVRVGRPTGTPCQEFGIYVDRV